MSSLLEDFEHNFFHSVVSFQSHVPIQKQTSQMLASPKDAAFGGALGQQATSGRCGVGPMGLRGAHGAAWDPMGPMAIHGNPWDYMVPMGSIGLRGAHGTPRGP